MMITRVGLSYHDNENNCDNDADDNQGDDQACGYDVEAPGGGAVVPGSLQVPNHLPVSGLLGKYTHENPYTMKLCEGHTTHLQLLFFYVHP